MGTIYRVRHRLLDEIRVVKVMQPHVVGDAEMRRRFLEEARTATRLKHPHLCVLYDFALDSDGTAYLVMEYIEGVNLADFLKSKGAPGIPTALEIAHQALLALGYLHRKGVIHRDVAPDNLMLSGDEEGRLFVKLIDLGIAKEVDRTADLTASGVFLGKLRYASPEQYGTLAPGQKLDGRSDLYGLGIVLYELLTGTRPFPGESAAELLRAHLLSTPTPFSESDPDGKIPPELRAIVLKALEKNRDDRFASAEEMDREIAVLRPRLTRPGDLDQTRTMLEGISASGSVGSGVTPSAQSRLDRQFADHTTPYPTPSGLTKAPTVAGSTPGRIGSQPAERPAPAPRSAADATDTEPLPRPRRRRALAAIVSGTVLALAALWLAKPWRANEAGGARTAGPSAAPAVSPTRPPDAEAPSPVAAASVPETTSAEAAGPPSATLATEAPPEPTAAPGPTPEDPRTLRRAAESARAATARARQSAQRAGASELAGALYEVGSRKEKEAERQFAAGNWERAREGFEAAAGDYTGATSWIASHPRKATAPPERVAAASEPAIAPSAAARPEAAPTLPPAPSTVPPRAPTSPPTEPARALPTDADRIRAVLHEFERAQNTLDLDLYARLYPSLSPTQRQNLERAWQGLSKQQVDLEIRQVDVKGSHAVARVFQRLVAVPRIGSELRDARERTLQLEKRGETWLITGLD